MVGWFVILLTSPFIKESTSTTTTPSSTTLNCSSNGGGGTVDPEPTNDHEYV